MGEAKRKSKRRRDLEQGIKEMHAEGQGAWQITVITPEEVLRISLGYIAGDTASMKWFRWIYDLCEQMDKARPPALCLLCDHEFTAQTPPRAFVALTALRDDPTSAIGNGLCPKCAAHPNLMQQIADKYRQSMITDLRVIPAPHPTPGHA
jgi:hypothetical protein